MPPSQLVLLGHPVAHSLSPRMHAAALAAAGIHVDYRALDVTAEDLGQVLTRLTAAGAGGNVTIPHKAAVAARCARLEPLAERTGAVNTFWVEAGHLVGENTDVAGFDAAVRELLGELPSGARVAVVGAGGAAAGVLAAVERWGGSSVLVYNRATARAQVLAERFGGFARVAASLPQCLHDADLVVNATPVGLHDQNQPFALSDIPAQAAVLDLVYRAGDTALVREARTRGHRSAGGLSMLVEQGAAAFVRWFGIQPDRRVMWEAVLARG